MAGQYKNGKQSGEWTLLQRQRRHRAPGNLPRWQTRKRWPPPQAQRQALSA
ncbi:MAG: hypothetical protein WKG07_34545 [Hymenobacter sp.]